MTGQEQSTARTQRVAPSRRQPSWAGRQVLVYGWGRSGKAAAELLLDNGCGVLAVDDREQPAVDEVAARHAAESRVRAVLAAELETVPAEVEMVVPSPGVPPSRPLLRQAAERGLPILGELEIAAQIAEHDLVAITGSNGKSTTTELVGALLRAAGLDAPVCGNIGTPLSECVRTPSPTEPGERVLVVEVSSFQLETVATFRPRVAALLNLSDDHLDRHGSFASYAAVKRRIFARQGRGDVAVLNADDRQVASTELAPEVRRRLFSRLGEVEDGAQVTGDAEDRIVVLQPGAREVLRLGDLMLQGEHNVENVLAACAIADAYLDGRRDEREAFATALERFAGLPHRLQLVATRNGVSWYDDSKGTNVGATIKSLEGFGERSVHLILGGQGKGADFADLRPWVERKAARVYLIGEAAEQLSGQLRGDVELQDCGTLERAVARIAGAARPGEVALLSPACASFDQFRNYAHRGEVFTQLVQGLDRSSATARAVDVAGEVDG